MACSGSSMTAGERHGETATGGHGIGGASAGACVGGPDGGRTALRAGGVAAGAVGFHAGANRGRAGYWPRHRGQIPGPFAQASGAAFPAGAEMGWAAAGRDEHRTGAQFPAALGQGVGRRRHAGGVAAARRVGPETRAARDSLGGVSHAGAPRLAKGGSRYPTPQERPRGAGGVEKNSPRRWQPC